MLAAYFGAPIKNDCRICDNCINRQAITLAPGDFEIIEKAISRQLQPGPMDVNILVNGVMGFRPADAWQVINYLLAEEKLAQTGDGLIGLRRN
jgi:hypothetical protein